MLNAVAESSGFETKTQFYRELESQLRGLFAGEHDVIANAANMSALVFSRLADVNWVGFYFWHEREGELVLGPFQGKPACIRIASGRGVCGTAFAERRSVLVPDVHLFAGHIACDAASRSELVVPLLRGDEAIGVFDLDSPVPARFDEEDRVGLERLSRHFIAATTPEPAHT